MAAGTEKTHNANDGGVSERVGAASCRQVKSRDRVAKHGEVFTAKREVNAMLDLVKHETERLDSRFLEPACGTGNFLEEILFRKLVIAERKAIPDGRKKPIPEMFERNSIVALTSIYGVELQDDNVKECRERLYKIWNSACLRICRKSPSDVVCKCARFILERNIICGNALSMKKVDENREDTEEPIVFSEWGFVGEYKVKRTDYRLDRMLEGRYRAKKNDQDTSKKTAPVQCSLFEVENAGEEGDVVKEFSILPHYARIAEYGE